MTIRCRNLAIAFLVLSGCGMPHSTSCAPYPIPADLAPASDMSPVTAPDFGSCGGRACEQDTDCPPSLCATATEFGVCRDGFCQWK